MSHSFKISFIADRFWTGGLKFCASFLISTILITSPVWAGNKIILIGGPWTSRAGHHDYPHGIQLIDALLKQSPALKSHPDLVVEAHPHGWPSDEALKDAATLVFYFSGGRKHPLRDPEKRRQVKKLMDQGVGMVALHQAFTLPANDTSVPLVNWLGGARYGKADRATLPVQILLPSKNHAVAKGLETFVHFDEYYPLIRFNKKNGTLTPLWNAEFRPHYIKGVLTADSKIAMNTVAWAFERDNGGRSFAYSGGHFLVNWDKEQSRKILLNAILWTAGKDVPPGGVTSTLAPNAAKRLAFPEQAVKVKKAVMSPRQDNIIEKHSWGHINWLVSGALQNSSTLTTGLVTILAGKSNPRHFHPNCDEVLHVLKGRILHTMDDVTVEMKAGDTVSIPKGVLHNATPLGNEDAVMTISYSSAWREVVGE